VRLLLDEHIDPTLAERLRERGHDAIAVAERPELRGLPDDVLLDWSSAHGLAIATYDARGFLPTAVERLTTDRGIAGLVLISERTYASGPRGYGALLRALEAFMKQHAAKEALTDRVIWLR